MSGALGRRTPPDFDHVERYPLSALPEPPKGVPGVGGFNWYSSFDHPVRFENRWWVGRTSDLGTIRGGHCICFKPGNLTDYAAWYPFYDQGSEGACIGFGSSRCMSLFNRVRYDARWLWNQAKIIDPWPDTNPGDNNGTDVNSAMKILKAKGHVRDGQTTPSPQAGVQAYRWTNSAEEALTVLRYPLAERLEAVPFLNSWGESYPHLVWMPLAVLQRLMDEDGEFAIPTDR